METDLKYGWVCDNYSKLLKYNHNIQPELYGLPLFHLYYSQEKDGNRVTDKNKIKHAFRIIVGLTWNWTVCRLTGVNKLPVKRLDATMSGMLHLFMNKKTKGETAPFQVLEMDPKDPKYIYINELRKSILILEKNLEGQSDYVAELKKFFSKNLAQYATDVWTIAMFVPFEKQREYIDTYTKANAFDAWMCDFQMEMDAKIDLTNDKSVWAKLQPEDSIRNSTFLSGKQIQRLLAKTGTNTKAKHGRRICARKTTAK
jgi:hypothetical protein